MAAHRTVVCEYGFRVSTCRCAAPDKQIVRVDCQHSERHSEEVGPYGRQEVYKPKHRKDS